jgi:hypothetical protein
MTMTFQSVNGVRFTKGENGSVRIELEGMHVDLDRDHWASVIAQMSYYGEEDYGYYRALEFHGKIPVHETCPLKDKPRPDWK